MNPRPLSLLAFLVAATACTAPSQGGSAYDAEAAEAEVRAASLALLGALNDHDADAILAHYLLDDDFTQVVCTEVRVGGSTFAAITRAFHAQFPDAVYDMRVSALRMLGSDVAVVSLEGTMTGPLFISRVLHRTGDGRWLVAWEHSSWPGCEAPRPPHPGTGPEAGSAPEAVPNVPTL